MMKVQSRIVREGEKLCVDARFNVKFTGDWESILETNSIEVVVDDDNLHCNDDSSSSAAISKLKWTEGPSWLDHGCLCFTDTIQGITQRSLPLNKTDGNEIVHMKSRVTDV